MQIKAVIGKQSNHKRHYEQFADGTVKDIEDEIPIEVPEGWAWCRLPEICVIPKEIGTYELALIPSQSKIKVLIGRTLNEDSLKYMMIVLDVVNLLDTDVSEVDLRYGAVSCRK